MLQCPNFLHCYVYRHANLCSGLRAILSPQLIKKFFAIFEHTSKDISEEVAPLRFEPAVLSDYEQLSRSDALLTTPWASDEKCGYCGSTLYNFNVCNKFKRSFKASALF